VRVTRFHHVSVNTNGAPLDDLAAFYGDVLGLGSKPRPEIPGVPGHWHVVGDQELHLVGAPPHGTPIDSAINELEERGIAYERAVQGEDTVQIWISDPAGNTIELQQDTAVS
jgi:catechol 2,3-dioxygenase-like lactoylglutathione lyase family enzyme